MGPGPIFLALQRPRQLDAHGVALFRFGQIVSDHQKKDTCQQRDDDLDPGGIAQRRRQGQAIAQH